MSDYISRQAAISAICNACGKIDCDKMDKCEKLQLPPANCSEFPNNSDTISRQAAIEALKGCYCGGEDSCGEPWTYEDHAIKAVEQLPPIQPKRGKWIDKGERGDWEWQADGRGRHWHEWECNTCHHYFAERSFFCTHCGSDMREVTT